MFLAVTVLLLSVVGFAMMRLSVGLQASLLVLLLKLHVVGLLAEVVVLLAEVVVLLEVVVVLLLPLAGVVVVLLPLAGVVVVVVVVVLHRHLFQPDGFQ